MLLRFILGRSGTDDLTSKTFKTCPILTPADAVRFPELVEKSENCPVFIGSAENPSSPPDFLLRFRLTTTGVSRNSSSPIFLRRLPPGTEP